jgi:hypothetical protein
MNKKLNKKYLSTYINKCGKVMRIKYGSMRINKGIFSIFAYPKINMLL